MLLTVTPPFLQLYLKQTINYTQGKILTYFTSIWWHSFIISQLLVPPHKHKYGYFLRIMALIICEKNFSYLFPCQTMWPTFLGMLCPHYPSSTKLCCISIWGFTGELSCWKVNKQSSFVWFLWHHFGKWGLQNGLTFWKQEISFWCCYELFNSLDYILKNH